MGQISFSNEGRIITTNDSRLDWIARGLHKRLEHYGDIKGVACVVNIYISLVDGDIGIKVDQNCLYIGYHNGFKGNLTKMACEMALKSIVLRDLMCISVPKKTNKIGGVGFNMDQEIRNFYQTEEQNSLEGVTDIQEKYNELLKSICTLSDSEKLEIYRFLD